MHASQGMAQNFENARAAIMLIALVIVIFWRVALRVLLAIIAVAFVALVGSGAVILLQSLHRS